MAADGKGTPVGPVAEAFRLEAEALERALSGEADATDDVLRDRLDRLGDLFLAMTGRAPPDQEGRPGPDRPGPDLPGSGGPR